MPFSVQPKDGPAKVEGALNRSQKTTRERAIDALLGGNTNAPTGEAPVSSTMGNPNLVPPEAASASNLSPEQFSGLRQRYSQEQSPQTPQSESVEAAPPAPPAPSEVTQKQVVEQSLAPRYAQLARQEKALRARDAAIRAEKAELQKARETMAAERATMQSQFVPKDRLSKETLTVLQEMGIDYNALSQQALNAPDPEFARRDAEISSLKATIDELKQQVEGTKKSFEDNQTQSYQQAKQAIHANVVRLVNNDPTYETIKATGSSTDVVDLIEKTFNEGLDADHPKGYLMSEEEAAQIVEEYLVDEALKLSRLGKIQQRLNAKAPPQPQQQPPSEQRQTRPTLTNTMTGAPKTEYNAKQRAVFAAQYGPNWREKVGSKT